MPNPFRPLPSLLAALFLAVVAPAQGVTTLVSRTPAGLPGNGGSTLPDFTPDGRFVAYESEASNLVPGDTTGFADIFVFDSTTNANARISVTTAGAPADFHCTGATISADARYVAFNTQAPNLIGSPTGQEIVVRDRQTGTTTCATCGTGPGTGWIAGSSHLSGDGRFLAYAVDALLNGSLVTWRLELATGARVAVSVDAGGVPVTGFGQVHGISHDGRYVVFTSTATTLVANDTNATPDAFVRDVTAGTTVRASLTAAGAQSSGATFRAQVSDDGRFAAFESSGTDVVSGFALPLNGANVFVRDLQLATTTAVSRTPAGTQPGAASTLWSMSPDGQWIGFASSAADLVAGDTNLARDGFVHALATGTVRRTTVGTDGAQLPTDAIFPMVDATGARTAFERNGQIWLADATIGTTRAYCFGDALCPCGNAGAPGRGCENAYLTGGALLETAGDAILGADELVLTCSSLPAGTTVMFLQGRSDLAPAVFDDGLLCVGPVFVRLGTKRAVGGLAEYGPSLSDVPVSIRGGVQPSATHGYQAWYRQATPGFCAAGVSNLSNGIEVRWGL